MKYDYDVAAMRRELTQILSREATSEEWSALQQRRARYEEEKKTSFFNLTFTAVPRLLTKNIVNLDEATTQKLQNIREDISVSGWTADRIARVWWLLLLPAEDEAQYIKQIESLFSAAEMNEQAALYGALPLLAYPKSFRRRAADGLRTNIKSVFEAIALDNPYPSAYFEEPAWNQMVLKAFFMDIPVNRIIGLDERANKTLAHILSDYAHERWAAGRPVNPLLWRPISNFIDEKIFPDIQKLFQSENSREIRAAALACAKSSFEPAKILLQEHDELAKQIDNNILHWEML